MNRIEWDDSLKIGLEEIDNQHHELIVIYNELCDAIEAHGSAERTIEILKHLGHYTSVHFATEEALMRMLEYPDYEAHKQAHDHLIGELRSLTKAAVELPQGVNFQLMYMIKQWLSQHILATDTLFVPHFIARGIKPTLQKKTWFSKFNLFGG
ncbi:MAG: bacteriohemerythrin [Pseudomonadota bacterium]|nr:bacteriohemerythrin [Pseudomonadota bacterium]